MSECFVNLKKTVDGDEVLIEDILKEKIYPIPIERIIRKPSDLFDKELILMRLEQLKLKEISKETYRKEINHLAKKFNSKVFIDSFTEESKWSRDQILRFHDFEKLINQLVLNN